MGSFAIAMRHEQVLAITYQPPMTLGNMRELGVHKLVASCLNDACRHVALISAYPRWRFGADQIGNLHCAAASVCRVTTAR
jgi:hypothetical protein